MHACTYIAYLFEEDYVYCLLYHISNIQTPFKVPVDSDPIDIKRGISSF